LQIRAAKGESCYKRIRNGKIKIFHLSDFIFHLCRMPLDYQKSTEEFQLGIWRLDESLEELQSLLKLSLSDLEIIHFFKSEYRKREWLTVRVLLKVLMPSVTTSIQYDENGKPHLLNSGYSISISHTKNFVAVILAKKAGVGIDLETIQPRIERIAKRFVTSEEENFIEPEKKIQYQHVLWGTKEVLYKIYGKGELDFLDHIKVEKFILSEKGGLTGRIVKGDFNKSYLVFYEQVHNLMLVYAFSS
jgi:4'-phosphopantetheinyl transferase